MITDAIKEEFRQAVGASVFFDEPMSRLTTFRIGGPADILVYPRSLEELQAALRIVANYKLPITIFGCGSNILVRDGGIRGVVINLTRGFQKIDVVKSKETTLSVGAGVRIPPLLDYLTDKGLSGLEFMAGIPGSVGGAIKMNAGTKEGTIGECVISVTTVDKKINTLNKNECGFGYRSSRIPPNSLIIEASLALKDGDSKTIRKKIERQRDDRIKTQPLGFPSAGSIFKNPTKGQSAGKLIEEAGLKEVRVGGARVSPKHGNFIINEDGASAKDVITLIGLIKDKIKEKYNIRLGTEVKIVGDGELGK